MLESLILALCSPDIIGRIKRTGAFKHSPHEAPTHIIMNEVGDLSYRYLKSDNSAR